MKKKNNAQTVLEYAVVIVVVTAALLAMFGFLRRSVQGNWKESADGIGGGRQFEEGVTTVIK